MYALLKDMQTAILIVPAITHKRYIQLHTAVGGWWMDARFICPRMGGLPLDGWTPWRDRTLLVALSVMLSIVTLSVTLSIATLPVTRSIAVSNTLNHKSA